jgi:hypothetical protein
MIRRSVRSGRSKPSRGRRDLLFRGVFSPPQRP